MGAADERLRRFTRRADRNDPNRERNLKVVNGGDPCANNNDSDNLHCMMRLDPTGDMMRATRARAAASPTASRGEIAARSQSHAARDGCGRLDATAKPAAFLLRK